MCPTLAECLDPPAVCVHDSMHAVSVHCVKCLCFLGILFWLLILCCKFKSVLWLAVNLVCQAINAEAFKSSLIGFHDRLSSVSELRNNFCFAGFDWRAEFRKLILTGCVAAFVVDMFACPLPTCAWVQIIQFSCVIVQILWLGQLLLITLEADVLVIINIFINFVLLFWKKLSVSCICLWTLPRESVDCSSGIGQMQRETETHKQRDRQRDRQIQIKPDSQRQRDIKRETDREREVEREAERERVTVREAVLIL